MISDHEDPNYRAFISYSHADKEWVDWLHKALETYVIPRHLVGTAGRDGLIPKNLFPIFRDREELPSAHDLSEQIGDALKRSVYMIVVCSRRSAQSQWVNEEILAFKRLGRENRVLALIIDGEPNATDYKKPQKECFPQALRYTLAPDGSLSQTRTEPIAADARSRGDGKEKAALKIIAGLLGVAFDRLAQREKQRHKERFRIISSIVLTAMVMVAGSAGAWWYQTAPHTAHYRNFTTRYGIPEGVGELSPVEARQAYESFAITRQQGKVIQLRFEDNRLRPKTMGPDVLLTETDLAGAATLKIDYVGDRGFVASLYDARDKALGSKEYTYIDRARSAATVTLKTTTGEMRTLDAGANALPGMTGDTGRFRSAITRLQLNFDQQGRLISRQYQTAMGDPTADALGSFGTHYDHNARGLPVSVRNIDSDGNYIPLKSGVSEITIAYDRDQVQSLSWLDSARKAAFNDVGVTSTRLTRDAHGNLTGQAYYGPDAQPVMQKQICAARISYVYGLTGERTQEAYFGADGQPVLTCDQGVAKIVTGYDKEGRPGELQRFGPDGKLVPDRQDGVARVVRTFDAAGNVTAESYFDENNRPVLSKSGNFARVVRSYDARGQMLSRTYFGTDGRLIGSDATGLARTVWAYDENGQVTDEAYFGADGKPVADKQTGVAAIRSVFKRGNEAERAFFGVDGRPVENQKMGASRIVSAYDNRGNRVAVGYFDVDGAPRISPVLGYAHAAYKYDDRGDQTRESYFNASGAPMALASNVATVRHDYDGAGNLVEEAFLNTTDQPTASRVAGYARATWTYDKRGNPVEARYFAVDGSPMVNWVGGYARVTWAYDARGNRIEQRYFDVKGQPVIDWKTNVARTAWVYDAHGKVIETRHFDAGGAPTMSWVLGYARAVTTYDAQGNQIEESYFGADDKPLVNGVLGYGRVVMHYDARGREDSEAYFGIDGKPALSKSGGVAMVRFAYDERGNCIRWEYFDQDMKPKVELTTGTAVYRKVYDATGGLVRADGLNAKASPVSPRGEPRDPRRN